MLFDPSSLKVDAIAGEAPVARERLNADWLQARFQSNIHWTPENLPEDLSLPAVFSANERPNFISSAVLVPIVLRENGLTLLLTQRTAHLSHHSGQISFPGGRREASDFSAVAAALRETHEEIGLPPDKIQVIGTLPDCYTISGYQVTPVVGLLSLPLKLQPAEYEVQEIFEVPLDFLMDGNNHQRRTLAASSAQLQRTFYTMPYQKFFIWGVTAIMVRNLFHFLRA